MAKHISVKGPVQGAGFRSYVYGLATRLNLRGWVYTSSGGVEILVDGPGRDVEQFIASLQAQKPVTTRIDHVSVQETAADGSTAFEIRLSPAESLSEPLWADIAICPDCERELFRPRDRRYLYPFISCAHCGPRFTIIRDLPYDRARTAMAEFVMCESCRTESLDPSNRRFESQPVACPDCGPFVELRETHSQFPVAGPRISSIEIRTSAVLKARRLLREGYIVAIKGLGGFHLACDASNPYTVAELRDRKGCADKPFPVMAASLAVIASVCDMTREEQLVLAGREKPIVLLARRRPAGPQPHRVSELVAPNLDRLGVMLPYTALHHMLLNQTDPVLAREPVPPILVLTSSNFRGEPIAIDNKEALQRLSPLADASLLHNRPIHIRSDDSVVRVDEGDVIHLRRSRGYAPYRVSLSFETEPTLAVGDVHKNTFCLTRGRQAFLGHHIGDMGNAETRESFQQSVGHLARLFQVQPELIAHDLHPDAFMSEYASQSGLPRVAAQHHHAHIASCMVDNGLTDRRLIGLAFDGAGYGADGMVWGGEVLLASFTDFERFAHLEYLPLPGAEASALVPWRIAAGYCHALGIDAADLPFLQNVDKKDLRVLRRRIDGEISLPLTSSMGRLFDAVASLSGVRNEASYAAQPAAEMEALSRPFISSARSYPYALDPAGGGFIVRLKSMLSPIVRDVRAGEAVGLIGARFHRTIADLAIGLCRQARQSSGLNEVALSGGVWQNQILLDLVCLGLRQDEFIVYSHRQVPCNDGGLALGQAAIANHSPLRESATGYTEKHGF